MTGWAVPGEAGSKVTSRPPPTAVHCVTVGHASALTTRLPSMIVGVVAPGAVGSNVTSRPEASTAVHWLLEGQATATILAPEVPSTDTGTGVPGARGANVTARPAGSTAVH